MHKSLDTRLKSFNNNIILAAKKTIPRGKRKKAWIPYWNDAEIGSLITERDSMNELLKTKSTEENRKRLSELTKKVEDKIAECRRRKWEEFCSNLNPKEDAKHWKIVKTLNRGLNDVKNQTSNIIRASSEIADTNKKSANMFANHYSESSRFTYNREDKKLNKFIRKTLLHVRTFKTNDNFSTPITKQELERAINNIPAHKSPGKDLIFGEMGDGIDSGLHLLGKEKVKSANEKKEKSRIEERIYIAAIGGVSEAVSEYSSLIYNSSMHQGQL
ncbi:hypothetical protein JTE90_004976 [Oedothorax gibbosus]|uniref:Uncharacterized protein n=1 Tax=Oedothorax gibbosus TaxID=931172 RepID=A0AAV6VG48_9ARAC|nr:hypothetical protein JTE90_004976 [Oedothorax gibbosus]